MTTAFVLSGGGSLGAVQVGMLQALVDHGIAPDLLVGTSAGALNAAFVAGQGVDRAGVEALADVWVRLRTRSVFSLDVRHALGALLGQRDAFCDDRGLRALLHRHLRFTDLEESPIPLLLVATDLLSGRETTLSTGDAQRAVLASCAIPGVFPPVALDGHALVDGGLANNTAVSQAIEAGADTVYVLPSGYSCALPEPPRTPLGIALSALTILMHQRLIADLVLYAGHAELVVLPPPCPIRTSALDFSHSDALIRAARREADAVLSAPRGGEAHPERRIALHVHRRPAADRASLC